jgi:hypothetical protein
MAHTLGRSIARDDFSVAVGLLMYAPNTMSVTLFSAQVFAAHHSSRAARTPLQQRCTLSRPSLPPLERPRVPVGSKKELILRCCTTRSSKKRFSQSRTVLMLHPSCRLTAHWRLAAIERIISARCTSSARALRDRTRSELAYQKSMLQRASCFRKAH